MELEKVKEKILDKHYPEPEELQESEQLFHDIRKFIEDNYGLKSHFAGSASRGTCRKGDKDVDVFVLFPRETSRRELEDKGLEVGKEVFENLGTEHHVEYAEHPYTKGLINGHEVEIVPCYDVSAEKIQSSVDRTPHHTRWVKENLDKDQRRDVVALKKFLEAQNLYGSSLKVKGFSGYLCEVLIAYYGSFEDLISEASSWDRDKRIEFESSEKQFESSFVVVDPVDSDRNVAAVLSQANYAKFIFKAWQLEKNPSVSMFKASDEFNEFELKQEVDNRADFLVLKFEKPDEVEDIVYPQLRKFERLLTKKLEGSGFRLYDSGVFAEEKAYVFFELDRTLPETEIVKGPQVYHNETHLTEFSGKYSNIFAEDERLCAKTIREFTDARELLKSFLDRDVEGLKQNGVPNKIAPELKEYRFADILSGEDEWLKYLYNKFHL